MPKKPPPKPPTEAVPSLQYDMFSNFLDNDKGNMSNLVEVWQSIPKYFLTPHQTKQLRTKDGLAQPYKLEYTTRAQSGEVVSFTVKIQPALIEQKDGTSKAFFPSVTEELVEEALKKIFATQVSGMHVPEKLQSWVKFSIKAIEKELKETGRTRNHNEIKHALEVMRNCNIIVYREGKEIYNEKILSSYVAVSREEYLDDSDALHLVRLPSLISEGINSLRYKQFNYERLMSCDYQLTRWLYQRFISRYTQADHYNSYHFKFSDIQQSSGLLMQANPRHNRVKMLEALDELREKQVLLGYEVKEHKEGRKICEVTYEVRPHPIFVKEQKAANKRRQQAGVEYAKARLT